MKPDLEDKRKGSISRREFITTALRGAGILTVGAVLSGCEMYEEDEPESRGGKYITASDMIYFSENYVGLGNFYLGMSDALWLTESPDFHIHGAHAGGVGDTLQINSNNLGVFMKWAYRSLIDIELFNPWSSEVAETGIRFGSSVDDFISAYPNAVMVGGEYKVGYNRGLPITNYKGVQRQRVDSLCAEISGGIVTGLRLEKRLHII